MKNIFCLTLLLGYGSLLFSQDCKGFIPNAVNTTLEYNHLNPKGKLESSHKTIVKEINQSGDTISIKTQNLYYDNKGTETYKSDFEYTCINGMLSFKMSNMFDPSLMSQYQTMEIKLESDNMDLPSNLTAGQELNNGKATMIILNQGVKMMTMTVDVTNRKVEAIENVTVPAGTYECYKITYDIETKVMFKVQAKASEWHSMNIGLVKSESFDKNGKLTGTTELKSYTK